MSETDKKIYEFIKEYTVEHLYPPSIREICENVDRCTNTVWHHLRKLEKDGLIELPEYATPRAIRLVGFRLVPRGQSGKENENA
jgi:repressor LexA